VGRDMSFIRVKATTPRHARMRQTLPDFSKEEIEAAEGLIPFDYAPPHRSGPRVLSWRAC